ncbi:LytR/AlgR family response regulator transcription factor [Flagellimonas amphidinii]|uniref:LytR/AlgR family response regulator transcription factor n=2 Tax=Flavobacteriales TaxID=200644 RepID=UPI001492E089|nr:LytTR family DNA-binding domain-containing protein [Allomuricauda amphidinii]
MMKCLILEDEKAAQEILQDFIEKTPFLQCIGIYESGIDIPHLLIKQADILFLDIELPELNGLSYLKTIDKPPKVIITTAYVNYAVDAFEENVLDYLVKPFSYERFFKAIARAKDQILKGRNEMEKYLFVYTDKTHHRIFIDDILYLKAEVDYIKVVTNNVSLLVLDSLRNWEEKVAEHDFLRSHRSYIINTNKIDKVYGNQVFVNNEAIPIGQSYKNSFMKSLNI